MSADEWVDVVDDRDRVVARATRAEVRQRNLWHRAVYVLVFNAAGQLFVHQRTASKDVFPGYWDLTVGGVLAAGEDYDTGARRELREEIGIEPRGLRRLFPIRYEDAVNRVAGMVYSCTCDQALRLQTEEIVRGEWLDLDVVLERLAHDAFCPDGLEAFARYVAKLDEARQRR
jgi:isopentenyldiphosphate isomerase